MFPFLFLILYINYQLIKYIETEKEFLPMDIKKAFQKSKPITVRPANIAHELFQAIKEETGQESSELLTEMIKDYAKNLHERYLIGPESKKILNLWYDLDALGAKLGAINPENKKG